jgi:hypothetical protein
MPQGQNQVQQMPERVPTAVCLSEPAESSPESDFFSGDREAGAVYEWAPATSTREALLADALKPGKMQFRLGYKLYGWQRHVLDFLTSQAHVGAAKEERPRPDDDGEPLTLEMPRLNTVFLQDNPFATSRWFSLKRKVAQLVGPQLIQALEIIRECPALREKLAGRAGALRDQGKSMFCQEAGSHIILGVRRASQSGQLNGSTDWVHLFSSGGLPRAVRLFERRWR